jgi:hypothetical protein
MREKERIDHMANKMLFASNETSIDTPKLLLLRKRAQWKILYFRRREMRSTSPSALRSR